MTESQRGIMLPVLLSIGMLMGYFRQGRLAEQRVDLVRSINAVVLFRQHQWPIIWVRQEFAPDLSNAFRVMREQGIAVMIADTDGCQVVKLAFASMMAAIGLMWMPFLSATACVGE